MKQQYNVRIDRIEEIPLPEIVKGIRFDFKVSRNMQREYKKNIGYDGEKFLVPEEVEQAIRTANTNQIRHNGLVYVLQPHIYKTGSGVDFRVYDVHADYREEIEKSLTDFPSNELETKLKDLEFPLSHLLHQVKPVKRKKLNYPDYLDPEIKHTLGRDLDGKRFTDLVLTYFLFSPGAYSTIMENHGFSKYKDYPEGHEPVDVPVMRFYYSLLKKQVHQNSIK